MQETPLVAGRALRDRRECRALPETLDSAATMSDIEIPGIDRRTVLAAPLAFALARPAAAAAKKVLRLCYRGAETSFDPAKISDLYSRAVTTQIFEALYG